MLSLICDFYAAYDAERGAHILLARCSGASPVQPDTRGWVVASGRKQRNHLSPSAPPDQPSDRMTLGAADPDGVPSGAGPAGLSQGQAHETVRMIVVPASWAIAWAP